MTIAAPERAMTAPCPSPAWNEDPEAFTLDTDPIELAAQRDQYAAEAQALIRQLADAHAREIFLNNTINDLRAQLAGHRQHAAA